MLDTFSNSLTANSNLTVTIYCIKNNIFPWWTSALFWCRFKDFKRREKGGAIWKFEGRWIYWVGSWCDRSKRALSQNVKEVSGELPHFHLVRFNSFWHGPSFLFKNRNKINLNEISHDSAMGLVRRALNMGILLTEVKNFLTFYMMVSLRKSLVWFNIHIHTTHTKDVLQHTLLHIRHNC